MSQIGLLSLRAQGRGAAAVAAEATKTSEPSRTTLTAGGMSHVSGEATSDARRKKIGTHSAERQDLATRSDSQDLRSENGTVIEDERVAKAMSASRAPLGMWESTNPDVLT